MSMDDDKPKRSRRKPAQEQLIDNMPAETPEKPKRSRRKPAAEEPEASQAPEVASQPRKRRRKVAAPEAPEKSIRRKPAEKPAPKPQPKPAARKAKILAQGRIQRASQLAQVFVHYAPAWMLLILLLLIFGPNLLRSLRGAIRPPSVAPLFTPEVQHWAPDIARWSLEYGVDANLLATLIQIESCGYSGATSQVGAQGLFQVMPPNFEPAENMTDPETNARRGIGVIKDCLKWAKDDVGLALACYNGGPSLIFRDPSQWPAESQRYYVWGGGIFNDAERGASHSDTLDNWLASGGIGLCQQAAMTLGLSTALPLRAPTVIPPTPTTVLPTLSVVQPGPPSPYPFITPGLPTFDLPTPTLVVKLYLTPRAQ